MAKHALATNQCHREMIRGAQGNPPPFLSTARGKTMVFLSSVSTIVSTVSDNPVQSPNPPQRDAMKVMKSGAVKVVCQRFEESI
jgi:hypothetical protein